MCVAVGVLVSVGVFDGSGELVGADVLMIASVAGADAACCDVPQPAIAGISDKVKVRQSACFASDWKFIGSAPSARGSAWLAAHELNGVAIRPVSSLLIGSIVKSRSHAKPRL